jgi:hypothetical protein
MSNSQINIEMKVKRIMQRIKEQKNALELLAREILLRIKHDNVDNN